MVKEVSPQFNILGSTSVSSTNTITSSITGTLYRDSVCYQINLSGNPVGYVQINGSLNYSPGTPQGPQGTQIYRAGSWVTLASVSVSGSSVTPIVFDLSPVGVPWTQCQFVSSTGSGIIDVWVAGKSYG